MQTAIWSNLCHPAKHFYQLSLSNGWSSLSVLLVFTSRGQRSVKSSPLCHWRCSQKHRCSVPYTWCFHHFRSIIATWMTQVVFPISANQHINSSDAIADIKKRDKNTTIDQADRSFFLLFRFLCLHPFTRAKLMHFKIKRAEERAIVDILTKKYQHTVTSPCAVNRRHTSPTTKSESNKIRGKNIIKFSLL